MKTCAKLRRCTVCRRKKRLRFFYKNRTRSGGRDYVCRKCRGKQRCELRRNGFVVLTKQAHRRIRLRVLRHYSRSEVPFCACLGCNEKRIEFLALDHEKGGGSAHRRKIGRKTIFSWLVKNNFPPGFRVLCHNCNMAIGSYGVCPHETERLGLPSPGTVLPTRSEVRLGIYLESAEILLKNGIYPALRAVAVLSGLAERSLAQLVPHRKKLVEQGKWPCEVLARGKFRAKKRVKVLLKDGTFVELMPPPSSAELLALVKLERVEAVANMCSPVMSNGQVRSGVE